MPTGYKLTMGTSGDGSYKGNFGKSRKGSKHIRSFSLSQANSRYLDGVPKGNRSHVVNRCILLYRDSNARDFDDQIAFWKEAYFETLDELKAIKSDKIPDQEGRQTISSRIYKWIAHFFT